MLIPRYACCVALALQVVSPSAFAQTPSVEPQLPEGSWEWHRQSQVPVVSPEVRMGVLSASDGFVNANALSVLLPPGSWSLLCVRISSRDGLYWANLSYDVRHRPPGRYRLVFPTKFRTTVESYVAKELAVLAAAKESCRESSPIQGIFVANWAEDETPKRIVALLNSGAADAVRILVFRGRSSAFLDCVHLSDPQQEETRPSITYDTECVLDVDVRFDSLRIHRFMFEGQATPVRLPIVLP